MAARTIYSEFQTDKGVTYRVSLMTTGTAPIFEEVLADGNGFTLSYEGDDTNRFEEFKESSVSWAFYVKNSTVEDFLFDLEDDEDGIYYILVEEKVSTVWERRWVGPLELGNASWEDMSYPYRYELVATDGLAQLDDVLYNDPLDNATLEDPATRIAPAIDYILNSLNEITGAEEFAGNDMLAAYLNVYEENILPMTTDNSNLIQTDVLGNIYVDHLALVDIKLKDSSALEVVKSPNKEQLEAISQLEVLRNIMRVFGCRLYIDFETGLWTLDEVGAWTNRSTGQFLIYDSTGAVTGSDSLPSQLDFDNLQALSGGNTFYTEKYNSYSINYKHNISGLHMPDYAQWNGVNLSNPGPTATAMLDYYDTEYTIGGVSYGNGENHFDLELDLRAALEAQSQYIGDTAWLTVKCWIDNTTGGSDYYLDNSQGILKWTTDSTDRCNTSRKFPNPISINSPSVVEFKMRLSVPPLPVTGILKFKININNFKSKVFGVSASNIKAVTYSEGRQYDFTEYKASKSTSNNREINYVAGEVIIGDGPFWFSPSSLLWKDGTDYVQTANWIDRKQANLGNFTYYPILSIMSQYALDSFSNNRRVMEISFKDDFGPSRLLQRGDRVYRPTALTFTATPHIWDTTNNHIGLAISSGVDLGDNPVDTGRVGGTSTSVIDFEPIDITDQKPAVTSLDGGSITVAFNGGDDHRGGHYGYRPAGTDPASLIDDNYGNQTQ